MTRTREITTRLLKAMIRGKIKGGLDSRTAAAKTCTDLLASMRMSSDRKWQRGNRAQDEFVAEQRHLAADTKIGPGLRADACARLCVLAGYCGFEILGAGDADQYTRKLVTAPRKNAEVSNFLAQLGKPSAAEAALRRYEESKRGSE